MKAIIARQHGGPEVLELVEVAVPAVGEGQALVRLHAAGINFVDIYMRRDGGRVESLPYAPGLEGAGMVEMVGPDVTEVRPGERVAFTDQPAAYAEYVAARADRLVPVPEGIDFIQAAAALLQGLTAHYMLHGAHPLRVGETVLIHAAAGGMGQLLVQMAKAAGARVL